MRVRIQRGAAQIGWTCVELECEGERILLDLGMPLEAEQGDVPLPDVPGLRSGDPSLLGVVVSHLHGDHFAARPARCGAPARHGTGRRPHPPRGGVLHGPTHLCLPKSPSGRNALSHNAFTGYGRVEPSVGPPRDDYVALTDAAGTRARESGASAATRGGYPDPRWSTPTPRGVGPGVLGGPLAGVGGLEERPGDRRARRDMGNVCLAVGWLVKLG